MTTPAEPDAADDPQPQPPRPPEPGQCCQSGCEPCVYDMYWDALERYEQDLKAWQARNAARGQV